VEEMGPVLGEAQAVLDGSQEKEEDVFTDL
jgi:hypothetical protein